MENETPTPETDAETVEKVLDLFEALCASTKKAPDTPETPEDDPMWECRRCGTEYEGDTPNHDEQRYCRPDTPHDWQRVTNGTPMPERHCDTCSCATIPTPPECRCEPTDWYRVGRVHPICAEYTPVFVLCGGYDTAREQCARCDHDEACHA
jgi:hypothetical protein